MEEVKNAREEDCENADDNNQPTGGGDDGEFVQRRINSLTERAVDLHEQTWLPKRLRVAHQEKTGRGWWAILQRPTPV